MSLRDNNKVVVAPVSISDVKTVLRSSSDDLGTLCTSSLINQWSIRKPLITSSSSGTTSSNVVYYLNMKTFKNEVRGTNVPYDFQPVSYFSNSMRVLFNMVVFRDFEIYYKSRRTDTTTSLWSNHPTNLLYYARVYQQNAVTFAWYTYSSRNSYLHGYRLTDFEGYKSDEAAKSWLQVGYEATTRGYDGGSTYTVYFREDSTSAITTGDDDTANGTAKISHMRQDFRNDYGINFRIYCNATDTLNGGNFSPLKMLYYCFKDQGSCIVYMCIDVLNLSATVASSTTSVLYNGPETWSLSDSLFYGRYPVLYPYTNSNFSPWTERSDTYYQGQRHYAKRTILKVGLINTAHDTIFFDNTEDFWNYSTPYLYMKSKIKWQDLLPDFITGPTWLQSSSATQCDEYFEYAVAFFCGPADGSIPAASRQFGGGLSNMILPCSGNRRIIYIGKDQI